MSFLSGELSRTPYEVMGAKNFIIKHVGRTPRRGGNQFLYYRYGPYRMRVVEVLKVISFGSETRLYAAARCDLHIGLENRRLLLADCSQSRGVAVDT